MPLQYLRKIAQTPAPTFAEQERAALILQLWQGLGYQPQLDQIGNVLLKLTPKDCQNKPALLLASHLDTVFSAETDVTVTEVGGRLLGAGVGDNSASLAVLTAFLRDIQQDGGEFVSRLKRPLWLAANVGEEGLGDLRGAKHLLAEHINDLGAFVAVDGYLGIAVTQAVGVRRYRADYSGSGGHSWGVQGPSAVHAAAIATSKLYQLPLPQHPRTTLNVGLLTGGTSVNTIAPTAQLVLDLRSLDSDSLAELDTAAVATMHQAAQKVGVSLQLERVGDRAGGLLKHRRLLSLAQEAADKQQLDLRVATSSTDANAAIPHQLPALALGVYRGGNAHRQDEWVESGSLSVGLRFLKKVISLYQRSPVA